MSMLFLHHTVIAIAFLQVSGAAPQTLYAKTEHDAYAIYVTLVRPSWEKDAPTKGPMLLQRETEGPAPTKCPEFLAAMSGEWAEVASSFRRENTRARLLHPVLPIDLPYRLVAREEILADDARLAAKYPGSSNAPRPGSLEYIAVSAVGFNAARTKALVYVRVRTSHISDAVLMMELKERKWASAPQSCGGVA
jgi:hypothetical protein